MTFVTERVAAGAAVRVGRCQIVEAGIPCLEPGASTWTAGCVHEHITADISICADHEWRMTGRPWNCELCEEGDDPHKCPVLVKRAGAS